MCTCQRHFPAARQAALLLTLARELERRRSPPLTWLTRLAGAAVSGKGGAHICRILARIFETTIPKYTKLFWYENDIYFINSYAVASPYLINQTPFGIVICRGGA
jgi:hypothetical protein